MKPIKLIIKTNSEKYPIFIGKNLISKISSLMTYDESLTINFIENWRNHGEIIANKVLIQEAIDKSRDPSYNPCI